MGEGGEGREEEDVSESAEESGRLISRQAQVRKEPDWHGSTSIEINRAAEPKFRAWIKERTTRTSKPLYYEEARDGGAETVGVNPKTTPGWIAKLVSPQGDYILVHVTVEGKQRRQIVYKHSMLPRRTER